MRDVKIKNGFENGSIREQVKTNMYKHLPKCHRIDEIALNIFATANWVLNRRAEKAGKEKELQDFYDAEKELFKKAEELSLAELLKVLTHTQQQILDFFNPNKKEDNPYNAKRYVGFLLTDKLLRNCQNKICPEESLKEECVEYLQGLTIEEFVRYKAYLRWYDRTKDSYVKDDNKKLEDYLTGMGFLDSAMNNCENKKCEDKIIFWQKVVERKFHSKDTILATIKCAKKNTLKRLLPQVYKSHYTYVDEFVDRFYNHILKLSSLNQPSQDIAGKIVNSIYEKPHVVNMFEFILKCFLVSRLTREEHNQIRAKNNKLSVELVLK